jgi:hypothetical protein
MDFELSYGKVQEKGSYSTAFHNVMDQRITFLCGSVKNIKVLTKPWKPNKVDYIADSELVAKRALKHSPILWRFFQKEVLENYDADRWQKLPIEIRNKIEQTVGRAYTRAGLHPKSRYFA